MVKDTRYLHNSVNKNESFSDIVKNWTLKNYVSQNASRAFGQCGLEKILNCILKKEETVPDGKFNVTGAEIEI